MAYETVYLYGRHALGEALKNNPTAVLRVFVVEGSEDNKLVDLIKKHNITLTKVKANTLPKGIDPEAVHQGYIAEVNLKSLIMEYGDFISSLKVTPDTALVLLDEIQDPHNVGAIIRSSAGFGIAGVLVPEHNQAQISGAVIKVSAGMAFRVPLVTIGNVNNTVRDLKDKGFWIYGLDEDADHPLHQEVFDAPTVFILGNEAKGIREKTKELCDIRLAIALNPQCESLNVAASTAVTLYAWSNQHQSVLK